MADFGLNAEQQEFRKWVHEFAEKEIRPVAPQYDETEDFPWPVLKKAAEIGLYGFDFYMQAGQDESGHADQGSQPGYQPGFPPNQPCGPVAAPKSSGE